MTPVVKQIRLLPPPVKGAGSPQCSDLSNLSTPPSDPGNGAAVSAGLQDGGIESDSKTSPQKEYSKASSIATPTAAPADVGNADETSDGRDNVTAVRAGKENTEQKNSTPERKWRKTFDVLRDVVFGNSLYLTVHEQLVLTFIFRRTRMYGKEWEKIPLRHFTEGVCSSKA